MKPTLIMPNSGNSTILTSISGNDCVVIIGKNGSGKTKLGMWIEQCSQNVHRISAQKILNIPDDIAIRNSNLAERDLIYGATNVANNYSSKKKYRWQNHQPNAIIIDYHKVLSVIFSKENERNTKVVDLIRRGENSNFIRENMEDSPIDKINKIWQEIFPHRDLELKNAKVNVSFKKNANFRFRYEGKNMSDGEKVALYLMGQCFCVPNNSIILVDEPEIHLNKSILNILWNRIEEERPSCLFVYITHDLDFAFSRRTSTFITVEKYDGKNWIWQQCPQIDNIPNNIICDIIGTRKKILFVEGEKSSIDYQIYRHVYTEYNIIPVGSSSNVINYTKSYNENRDLHHYEAFGIIDRDYKPEEQLEKLKKLKIFALEIAEAENLFLVEEIIILICDKFLKLERDKIIDDVKSEIIDKLAKEVNLGFQVTDLSATKIRYLLETFKTHYRNKEALKNDFNNLISSIDIDKIYKESSELYSNIINSKNYNSCLKYYNRKSLVEDVARILGLGKGRYSSFILRLLDEECVECERDNIVSILKAYLPEIN